jgi:hypothetical protein
MMFYQSPNLNQLSHLSQLNDPYNEVPYYLILSVFYFIF